MDKYRFSVNLIYFKETGKYYGHGEYVSTKEHFFEIQEEVEEMLLNGALPGIGGSDWIVLIETNHPNNVPRLINPFAWRR